MTYNQALDTLIKTKTLSTDLLSPLNIPFENFLRFAQLSKEQQDRTMIKLIAHLERFRR